MEDLKIEKPKFLKPHLTFNTSYIKIGEDYTTDKIAVTELVKAGTLLATFENFEAYAKKGYQKAPLEPGENATYGEDGESIVASIPGYPRVTRKPRRDSTEKLTIISVEPFIIVSGDGMKGTMSLHPPTDSTPPITEELIEEILAEYGICFGVNEDALKKISSIIAAREVEFNKIPFAFGTEVVESVDSYLRFDMEIGPIAGTILEDGSIDFRDRKIMVGVNAGQCIATKIPAIEGEAGMNIFGEETPPRKPVDIKVQPLNDAKFIRDTNQVVATKDGVLSIVNNNTIKVLSHQVISGDIDYNTGNIDSQNAVTINGDVLPGFKINTVGDLKIAGGVTSAQIHSEANLVIAGGITGKNSVIEADGDCDINFIEQGKLTCGGICVLRKQAYYSNIEAQSDIRCKPQSTIMGGQIISGGSVTLYDVGGENSTPATIAAGVVASRLAHYMELKKSIVEQEEDIVKWLQRYKGSSRSKKVRSMEKDLAETKLKRIRVNLIPGTGIYSRAGGPKDDEDIDRNDPDYNADGGIDIGAITIDVYGEIFRDTEILIGNRSLKLDKTIANRQFKLHPNGKRIIATPIKKKTQR